MLLELLLELLKNLLGTIIIYFSLTIITLLVYVLVEPIITKDEAINKEIDELKNQNTIEAREKLKEVMKKKAPWWRDVLLITVPIFVVIIGFVIAFFIVIN